LRVFSCRDRNDPAECGSLLVVEHAVVPTKPDHRRTAASSSGRRSESRKYQHRGSSRLDSAEREAKTVVRGKVSGKLPEQSVTLEHIFALEAGRIGVARDSLAGTV